MISSSSWIRRRIYRPIQDHRSIFAVQRSSPPRYLQGRPHLSNPTANSHARKRTHLSPGIHGHGKQSRRQDEPPKIRRWFRALLILHQFLSPCSRQALRASLPRQESRPISTPHVRWCLDPRRGIPDDNCTCSSHRTCRTSVSSDSFCPALQYSTPCSGNPGNI